MSFSVIVFGPGPLGLGLVATSGPRGWGPHHAHRASDGNKPFIAEALKAHSKFRSITVAHQEVDVTVERVLFTDRKKDLERLRRLLVTKEDLVVCSAAGAGQSELAGILTTEVIPRRIENQSTGSWF